MNIWQLSPPERKETENVLRLIFAFLGSGCFAPLPLVVWRALLILGSTQGIARQASPGSQYSQFAIPGIEPKILLMYKKNTEH